MIDQKNAKRRDDNSARDRIDSMLSHLTSDERKDAWECMARALRSWMKGRPDGTLRPAEEREK